MLVRHEPHRAFILNLPVGLFYHVNYDMDTPYNVCGGMQDNYDWCGPSVSRHTHGIMNYDWIEIEGGDGFVGVPLDPRDVRIIDAEAQDGNIDPPKQQSDGRKQEHSPDPGERDTGAGEGRSGVPLQLGHAPLMSSPNDPGTVLTAANKVFKSTDHGDSWTVISPDLTTNTNRDTLVTMGVRNSEITMSRNDGVTAWSTIVSLAESPRQAGLRITSGAMTGS